MLPLMSRRSLDPKTVTTATGTIAATGVTETVIEMVAGIVIGIANDEIEVGTKVEERKMAMVMRE